MGLHWCVIQFAKLVETFKNLIEYIKDHFSIGKRLKSVFQFQILSKRVLEILPIDELIICINDYTSLIYVL